MGWVHPFRPRWLVGLSRDCCDLPLRTKLHSWPSMPPICLAGTARREERPASECSGSETRRLNMFSSPTVTALNTHRCPIAPQGKGPAVGCLIPAKMHPTRVHQEGTILLTGCCEISRCDLTGCQARSMKLYVHGANKIGSKQKRNHIVTYFISDGNERSGVQVPRGPARKESIS